MFYYWIPHLFLVLACIPLHIWQIWWKVEVIFQNRIEVIFQNKICLFFLLWLCHLDMLLFFFCILAVNSYHHLQKTCPNYVSDNMNSVSSFRSILRYVVLLEIYPYCFHSCPLLAYFFSLVGHQATHKNFTPRVPLLAYIGHIRNISNYSFLIYHLSMLPLNAPKSVIFSLYLF